MKSCSKIIPIDLYCHDILFVFGDEKYLRKSVRKYHTQEQTDAIMETFEIEAHNTGKTLHNYEQNAFIVWMPSLPTSPLEFGYLSHEIFHAATELLKSVGANLSDDSEEAYAYLIGFLTKRVLEEFPITSFVESGLEPASKPKQPPS